MNNTSCALRNLVRKAIKLRLENPDEVAYQEFLAQLCDLYQQAVRWQKDRRLSVGRPQKVEQLQADILALCTRAGESIDEESMPRHEATFQLELDAMTQANPSPVAV